MTATPLGPAIVEPVVPAWFALMVVKSGSPSTRSAAWPFTTGGRVAASGPTDASSGPPSASVSWTHSEARPSPLRTPQRLPDAQLPSGNAHHIVALVGEGRHMPGIEP